MTMPSLEGLPDELILFIVDGLSTGDTAALAQSGTRFKEVAEFMLYRSPDAWKAVWRAGHLGQTGTMRKVLAAGTDPNKLFRAYIDRGQRDLHSREIRDKAIRRNARPVGNGAEVVDADGASVAEEDDNERKEVKVPCFHPTYITFRALDLAARAGHIEMLQFLLDHGAEPNLRTLGHGLCFCELQMSRRKYIHPSQRMRRSPCRTALHLAICHFQDDVAKLLLERGALSYTYDDGECTTALHLAASTGQTDMCRYILERGYAAHIDTPNYFGVSPFYMAYMYGHWTTTVPFLLEQGANIDSLGPFGSNFSCTALFEACLCGRHQDAMKLIHLGANPDAGIFLTNDPAKLLCAPLHAAAQEKPMRIPGEPLRSPPLKYSSPGKRSNIQDALVEALVRAGADINFKAVAPVSLRSGGCVPLHAAVRYNSFPAFQALLAAGADVNACNRSGLTPLMDCRHLLPEASAAVMIKLLLDFGADINATNEDGYNILHFLCNSRSSLDGGVSSKLPEIVRLLLERGIKADAQTRFGKTAFQLAFEGGNIMICDELVRRRKVPQPIESGELHRLLDISLVLRSKRSHALQFLYDVDIASSLWTTSRPLMRMVQAGHLLDAEVHLNRKTPPLDAAEKSTILHAAIAKGYARLAHKLIALEAPVTTLDNDGNTPLFNALVAFPQGDVLHGVVEALLVAGADIHFRHRPNDPNRSPLVRAISQSRNSRQYSVIELMLRYRLLRDDPDTPRGVYLHCAVENDPLKHLVGMLLRAGAEATETDSHGDTPLS